MTPYQYQSNGKKCKVVPRVPGQSGQAGCSCRVANARCSNSQVSRLCGGGLYGRINGSEEVRAKRNNGIDKRQSAKRLRLLRVGVGEQNTDLVKL